MPEFFKHAIVMLSGAVLGQAIPLIISPILTRLYTPTEFGVFSSVVALAGILSVIVTLRFDLAVVLPHDRRDAANLIGLALLSSIGMCVGVWLIMVLLHPWLSALQMFHSLGAWWHAVPILALLIAVQQTFAFFANREKKYKAIASANVALQGLAAVIGIGIGYFFASKDGWINGLVIARVSGYALGVVFLYRALRLLWREYRPLISRQGMGNAAVAYRRFPCFNVPYSLAGVFSREFMVLALTSSSQLQAAGHYGFARLILNAPINFLTAALSQVFYREAAINVDTAGFRRFVLRLMLVFAAGLTPMFALAGCWAEAGFAYLFGEGWRESGVFAAMLMPIALLSVFTSWPERIFEVRDRQHWALMIQVGFDMSSVIGVIYVLQFFHNVTAAIAVYVAVQLLYQLVYLYAVFRLVGLGGGRYAGVIGVIAVSAIVILAMSCGLRYAFPKEGERFIIECFLASLFSVAGALLASRWITARFKGVE